MITKSKWLGFLTAPIVVRNGSATLSSSLGVIVAFITARNPSSSKPITVEDFWGGFLVGSIEGILKEELLMSL